jgi:hypothetical protein
MIFGKSDEQKYREEQLEIREQIYGVKRYAWWPFTKLDNGQYIWRQYYWEYSHGSINAEGKLSLWSNSSDSFSAITKKYTDQSIDHVSLTEPRTDDGKLSLFWFEQCKKVPSKEEVFDYRPTPKPIKAPPKKP